jgi:hypothetical protein
VSIHPTPTPPGSSGEIFWKGFFWTVTAAQATFQGVSLIVSLVNGTAAAAVAAGGSGVFVISWCVFGIFYRTMGFILILPLYILTFWITGRFRLHGFLFYGFMGLLGGVTITSAFMVIEQPLYWVAVETPLFLDRVFHSVPIGLVSGTSGGLTTWYLVGRKPECFASVRHSFDTW